MFAIKLNHLSRNYREVLEGRQKVCKAIRQHEDMDKLKDVNSVEQEIEELIREFNNNDRELKHQLDELNSQIGKQSSISRNQFVQKNKLKRAIENNLQKLQNNLNLLNSRIQNRNNNVAMLPQIESGKFPFYRMFIDELSCDLVFWQAENPLIVAYKEQFSLERRLLKEEDITKKRAKYSALAALIILGMITPAFLIAFSSHIVACLTISFTPLLALGLPILIYQLVQENIGHYEFEMPQNSEPESQTTQNYKPNPSVASVVLNSNINLFFNQQRLNQPNNYQLEVTKSGDNLTISTKSM